MPVERVSHADRRRRTLLTLLAGAALLLADPATAGRSGRAASRTPPPPEVTIVPDVPVVKDTPANLQAAFTNEMNAKERYGAFARKADLDGFPAVARLFRACARAEEVHGRRDVEAIAVLNVPARAVLDRVAVGTTEENLKAAIDGETWESQHLYPALLERARADHQPSAVRSMTFALSSEREHLSLLTTARDHLAERGAPGPLFVCPGCGKTVESVGFERCPNCFSPARRFIRIT